MSMFGIKEAVVAPLIRQLVDDHDVALGRPAIQDLFARATWSGLVEPGDGTAGAMIAVLGPAAALTAVIEGWGPTRVLDVMAEAVADPGGDSVVGVGLAPRDVAAALARWQPRVSSAHTVTALQRAVRAGARLLTRDDAAWPQGFADLGHHAPIALWMRGNLPAMHALSSSISLVGARAATTYGERVAIDASAGLVDRGYCIVSGAAFGIDGMAHRAALASSGVTVAILAGGVDRFYPNGHEAMLSRIVQTGAVISELPCGAPPTKWRFLHRNRLIAAASLATVVLEAGWRSGSLNTAGHAATIGRPLGAVPGPITSAASAGCHRLIRESAAVCVTNPDEMAELAPLLAAPGARGQGRSTLQPGPQAHPSTGAGRTGHIGDEMRVLDALSSRSARSVDDIAARSGLAVETVRGVLGGLDLEGAARRGEHGWLRST